MRFYLLIPLIVIAAVALVLFTPSSEADDEERFDDGTFVYLVKNDTEVYIDELVYDEEGDNDLGYVTIPETVIRASDSKEFRIVGLSGYVFFRDDITGVRINKYIRALGPGDFDGPNIASIDVDPDNPYYTDDEGVLFNKTKWNLIRYPQGKMTEHYIFPTMVSSVERYAFSYTQVKIVTLNSGMVRIGYCAFEHCYSLEHVNAAEGPDKLPSSVALIGDYAFNQCVKLTKLDLPDELEMIGTEAFGKTNIEEVKIPENLAEIGTMAFYDCKNLKRFVLTLDYNDKFSVDEYGVLYNLDGTTLVAYPAGSEMTEYTIPDRVTDIRVNAFSGCETLETIYLGKGMTTLPTGAFAECRSLKTITLDKVLIIGDYCFSECDSLEEVTFGSTLYYISDGAFYQSGLKTVSFGTSIGAIGSHSFGSCANLETVTFEADCEAKVEPLTFAGCDNLTSIYVNGYDVQFGVDSLDVYPYGIPGTVDVYIKNGFSIPADAAGLTTLNIIEEGKGPYPYENLIGVVFCVILIIAILAFVREV